VSTWAQTAGPVDARRWPDVVRVPERPFRAAIARRLFTSAMAKLPLRVEMADGTLLGCDPTGPLLRVRHPDALYARIGDGALIGFGEAYLAGDWDSPDLVGVLEVLARDVAGLVPRPLQALRRLGTLRQPRTFENTRAGARRNISQHYDLSNDLFALFLDETMTYSAAIFPSDVEGRPLVDLDAADGGMARAQRRKVDRLLDIAKVGPGTRLLEIGTGWGELALRAAALGARVTTITLSEEQAALARDRIRDAGLADRVDVQLRDYRDVTGEFDAVVSVEMIEAVGADYWETYFQTVDGLLAPGGRFALQAITMPHDRMRATRRTWTFIHKYVFPGGSLPSAEAIVGIAHRKTALRMRDDLTFGAHYAETLALWRARFESRAVDVARLGFDATFARMWEFYLAWSEAGFRSGYLDVHQMLLEKS
jgi:cyclopropane-fatty-acyl-phospholipid synthase